MGTSEAEKRILDGRIWEDFCDRLKAAGGRVDAGGDADGRLEPRARVPLPDAPAARRGLERAVDYADPQYPGFYRLADETKGCLNDNPDNYYENCSVDPRFDYRITGHRGTVPWFSIGVKAGGGNVDEMASTGEIDSSQIEFADDGTFEVLLSTERKPGNWLPMTDASSNLVVRQTFANRRQEKRAELSIECLNPERPNNNLDPLQLEAQLSRRAHLPREHARHSASAGRGRTRRRRSTGCRSTTRTSCARPAGIRRSTTTRATGQLAPDEALAVTIEGLPECQTWNLQLSNFWMESLDFRYFDISVNKFTARYEDDGSVRILIAHEDPGPAHPNWLNTLGHSEGGMLGRIVGADGGWPAEWKTEVVKLADVKG